MNTRGYGEELEYAEQRWANSRDQRETLVGVASGLQAVDGLDTSAIYEESASKYTAGTISSQEMVDVVEQYYETKEARALDTKSKEADIVASRLTNLLDTMSFNFRPNQLQAIHEALFKDFMGSKRYEYGFRDGDIRKDEPILAGESVAYATHTTIQPTLEYDFSSFDLSSLIGLKEQELAAKVADFVAGIWQIHPFYEGNTRTTAAFSILFLRSLGFEDIDNTLFKDNSLLFRNCLVRASYSNIKLGIKEDHTWLRSFFTSFVCKDSISFRNRDFVL